MLPAECRAWAAASFRSGWHHAASDRVTELHAHVWNEHVEHVQVSCRLGDPCELDFHRAYGNQRCRFQPAMRWRSMRPRARQPNPRFAGRPFDASPCLSQFWYARVACGDSLCHCGQQRWRSLVRDSEPQWHSRVGAAKYVRSRLQLSLDGKRGHGPGGRFGCRIQ